MTHQEFILRHIHCASVKFSPKRFPLRPQHSRARSLADTNLHCKKKEGGLAESNKFPLSIFLSWRRLSWCKPLAFSDTFHIHIALIEHNTAIRLAWVAACLDIRNIDIFISSIRVDFDLFVRT